MYYYSQGHICQCLTRIATVRRDSPVTIFGIRIKSGKQFVDHVLSLAYGLSQLGIQPGDVVAISALNSDLYLEWLLAVTFVGGIVAPINYRWSVEESGFALGVISPVMLVTDNFCNHLCIEFQNSVLSSLRWHVFMDFAPSNMNLFDVLTTEKLRKHSSIPSSFTYLWATEAAAIICFTSGTTGRPKGVTISHSALMVQSLAKIALVTYNEEDVYLHTAPLCHIGGISSALAVLMVGGCHVIVPKFEAKEALDIMERYNVTSLITVPAMMSDLISVMRMKRSGEGIKSIKKILNGGGSISNVLVQDAAKYFPMAKLLSAYGMTETCSSMTFMTLHDPTLHESIRALQMSYTANSSSVHKPAGVCVGKPAPHVELKICSKDSTDIGKIFTRGPHLMLRYWDQTSEQLPNSSNGVWHDTGDIGFMDDSGNLWLIGRTNGRIKSGGENVYPEEVEAILLQHPGVEGALVVGVPDDRLGEIVVACIKLRNDWLWSNNSSKNKEQFLSSQVLHHYCRDQNLTGFKIPKTFIVWKKEFPVTSTGKLRREHARKEVTAQLLSFPSNL